MTNVSMICDWLEDRSIEDEELVLIPAEQDDSIMARNQDFDHLAGVFLASSLAGANFAEFCTRVEETLQAYDGKEIASAEALWRIRHTLDLMKEYNARLWGQVD